LVESTSKAAAVIPSDPGWHVEFEQVAPQQSRPQAAQLFGSLVRLTQAPLQFV